MIIAIDGPAGSGKSTIARELAKRLGLRYLDTGAMYRTVTLLALEAGLIPDRIAEAGELAASIPLRLVQRENDLTRVFVGEREVTDEIRGRVVSRNVSAVSAQPAVRAVLTTKQREEASKGNVVLEGRDMGTVVVPGADVKVFLTASIEERARRRQLQLQAQGVSQPLDELIADITARDAYDSGRELAPLRKADDAVEIDTTGMTIDQVIAAVQGLAESNNGKLAAASNGLPPDGWGTKWPLCRMVRGPLDTPLYRFAYSFIRALVKLLFRVRIEGAENIPLTGPVVLASNHRSNLDPFFVGISSPRMVHFMAKAELWRSRLLGRVIEKMGAFPVKRGEADRNAVRHALEVLDAGAVVGLFPEGHRQRDRELGNIRAGVAMFSLREGTKTIPVVMRGTDRVVRNRILHFPRVRIVFGPPLDMPGSDLPRSERVTLVTERLVAAFEDLLNATAKDL